MCMSPHEMTSERIEEIIANLRSRAEVTASPQDRQYFLGRADKFEQLLKERAEAGTY